MERNVTRDAMEDESVGLLRFLYACPVGLLEISADGGISMMNPYAMQVLMPLVSARMVDNLFSVMERFAPELRNMAETFPRRQGPICEGHRITVTPGTRENDFAAKVLACTIIKLDVSRFVVTLADISAEVAREHRLKQAEVWFASLLDDIHDFAVLSMDAEGRVENVNSSTERQTGYTADDLLGRTPDSLTIFDPSSTMMTTKEQLACASRDGWHLSEGWHRKRNGDLYWCQRLIAVKTDVEHEGSRTVLGFLMVLRDISRRHADASQLVELLRKDHLTGAWNRSHFFSVAERECTLARQTGQPLAIIAVDLDHFKSVNDTYGHAAGDQVLKMFTEVTRSLLRPADTFARLGGEEFTVLLPNSTLRDAVQMAERLRQQLASHTLAPHGFSVTASFGCAQMGETAATSGELLAVADQALYAAKRGGRDRTEPSLIALMEQACVG